LMFFTNYLSHKGRELEMHARAAVVFHWDGLHRQVRMSGPILKSPTKESDDYFAIRPLASRIGAWASQQSEPLASRAQLVAQVDATLKRFHLTPDADEGHVPRPPHWGGYRLWPELIELWVEGPGRVHDRAVWTRTVQSQDDFTMKCGTWSATRLNP
ncbi:MAG TPA: pyridoxal 5'-phosphate synthase, partial [Steroidobacteraceae bacterium]|nr:pyridoxal 5'-phosphate synthase [Steroidobacteraceae bacterium]